MSDEKKQDSKPAADEGAALKAAVVSLKADLASAVGLLKEKDERIADLKDMVEHLKGAAQRGPAVLQSFAEAAELAKVQTAREKQEATRAEALEVAGPGAQHVKYIVGPSGTVRPEHGVVAAGTVIDVPVAELPSREWKAWRPDGEQPRKPKADPDTASAIQARNRPQGLSSAAERAIAQREALQSQREG